MKATAWERIPKNTKSIKSGFLTRIGDSQWSVEPYEYGFVVARMRARSKDGILRVDTENAKYPNSLYDLINVVSKLGHILDGTVVEGLEEAVKGQIRAVGLAVQLSNQLKEVIDNAKAA